MSNRVNSLSQNIDSSGNSLDSLSQNNKFSSDNRSSWFWGALQLSGESVNGSSNNLNLLGEFGNSLGNSVNNGLLDMNQWSSWSLWR